MRAFQSFQTFQPFKTFKIRTHCGGAEVAE
jgi:hypothetical protein